MRRLCILFVCGLAPYVAHGTQKYDTTEQNALVSSLQSDADLIHSRDIQKIRDFIKNEDTDFINNMSNLPEKDQIPLMRTWMAKKAFKFYYDKYMAEIKTQSKKNGRAIKTETYGYKNKKSYNMTAKYYWLDRGVLDTQQCKENHVKRVACDYPDGFEEYQIMHDSIVASNNPNNITETLIIQKDDIAANSSKFLVIMLTTDAINSTEGTAYNFMIHASGQTSTYTDYHRWRNQEQADIRNGKYRKPTKEEQANWRAKYKRFGAKLGTIVDESKIWNSSWLPDAAVTELTVDYDYFNTQSTE